MKRFSQNVNQFLDDLHHPLRKEIDLLREIILSSVSHLEENIKWNAPNYSVNGNDRITLKIMPPKQLQIIFHRGAAKQKQPEKRIVETNSALLLWKENDRAIATFRNKNEIEKNRAELVEIVKCWIATTT